TRFTRDWSSDVCSSDLENPTDGSYTITAKTEQTIRQSALEEIFGKLKKSGKGQHNSNKSGAGEEKNADRRAYQYGDSLDQIDMKIGRATCRIRVLISNG